jgi:hypothetical protein
MDDLFFSSWSGLGRILVVGPRRAHAAAGGERGDRAAAGPGAAEHEPAERAGSAERPANVRYERAEPRVVVNQPQGQPNVRFTQPGENRQAGDQNQQRPVVASQPNVAGQQATQPVTTGAVNAGNLTVSRIKDMDLYGAQGEQLGEIEHVFQGRDGKQYLG